MRKIFLLLVLFLSISGCAILDSARTTNRENLLKLSIGVTTCQDVLESFNKPLFTTKTKEGNQIWGYSRARIESINDNSVPDIFLIEFNKDSVVLNYQIMTIDETIAFKRERGCEPLLGNKDWFSWSENYKIEIVEGFIQEAKENGIIIKQSSEYYVKEVNTILSGRHNPDKIPIGTALRVTAIMDDDWDDGSGNKLGMASKYLSYKALEIYERLLEPED